jgi:hypothetical protein
MDLVYKSIRWQKQQSEKCTKCCQMLPKCRVGDFSDSTIFDFPAISRTVAFDRKRPCEHRGDVQPYLPLWQSFSSDKSWRRYQTDSHLTFHCFWQHCRYVGFIFLSVEKGYVLFLTVKWRLMLGSSRMFDGRFYLKFAMEKNDETEICTCTTVGGTHHSRWNVSTQSVEC